MSQRRYIVHTAVCLAALAAGVITTSAQAGLLGGIGGSAGGALTNGTLNVVGSGNGQAQGGLATPGGAVLQPVQRARSAASAARNEARHEAAAAKPATAAPTTSTPATPAPALATGGGANASASSDASVGASYSADGSVSR